MQSFPFISLWHEGFLPHRFRPGEIALLHCMRVSPHLCQLWEFFFLNNAESSCTIASESNLNIVSCPPRFWAEAQSSPLHGRVLLGIADGFVTATKIRLIRCAPQRPQRYDFFDVHLNILFSFR